MIERNYQNITDMGLGIRRVYLRGFLVIVAVIGLTSCQSAETRRMGSWYDAALSQRATASTSEEILASDLSLARIQALTVDSEIADAAEAENFFSALGGVVSSLPIPAAWEAPATLIVGVAGTIAATRRKRRRLTERAEVAESDRAEIVMAVEKGKNGDGNVDMKRVGDNISPATSDRIKLIRRDAASEGAANLI